MKEYILFQAYGSIDIINECKYSLLRLLDVYATEEKPQIIIYTDSKDKLELFENHLDILFKTFNQEKINEWKGSINFVHRIKIEVIRDALKTWPGKIIYCDTDTYCIHTLKCIYNSISSSNVFFYVKEGLINTTPDFKKWKKFLSKNGSNGLFNKSYSLQTQMWNAGVIGLQNSHLPLLNDVLDITDDVYPLFPKHTVEQFAFCYIFQKEGINISAAELFIFHYWNLKEFRILLARFFIKNKNLSIEDLVIASKNILPQYIVPAKQKFKKSGFITRLLNRIQGKGWSIKKHYV